MVATSRGTSLGIGTGMSSVQRLREAQNSALLTGASNSPENKTLETYPSLPNISRKFVGSARKKILTVNPSEFNTESR